MRREYSVRLPVLNAYLVRDRDRRRLRELGLLLAVMLPVGLCALGYVRLHLGVMRAGYEVSRLEVQLRERVRREKQLELEVAYLASPARIERRANEELGMRYPQLGDMQFTGQLP